MKLIFTLLGLSLTVFAQQQWRAATDLPGVNFTGLTGAQKAQVLAVIREFGCPCGCQMEVARCRVEDPPCSQSTALARIAVEAAKAGQDIKAALSASALV